MKKLRGIIAPIPTPFGEDGEVALDRLAENLERWNRTRLAGYAVLGSTGEYVLLSQDEKKAVLERARGAVPSGRVLLAGTGCESSRETIALTRWAGGAGFDFAMVVTPNYYKKAMRPAILRAHYVEVAEASSIPIVLYNVPVFTMINLAPEVVAELASHPNVAGIKDSAGDVLQLQEIRRLAPEDFSVLTGGGGTLLAALTVGVDGAILGVANVAFDLCVDLQQAFEAGDLPRARQLQERLAAVNRAVTTDHGIAGLKSLLDRIGFYGGPPRPPLRPPSADVQAEIFEIHAASSRPELSRS